MGSRKFAPTAWSAAVATMVASWLVPTAADAQREMPPLEPMFSHRHAPVDIDARPMISRMKISLVRPRRMLVGALGNLFVADWGAGTVLQVSPGGEVTIVAEKLNEPAGLAQDNGGGLYVCTHAQGAPGAGTIVRITETGEQTIFADGLTGPSGLAFDAHDNLFVANFDEETILRISPEGEAVVIAENIPSPAAVIADDMGQLVVASSTEGTLYRISPSREVSVLARDLVVPSDLVIDPQGHLIVANSGGTELSYVDEEGELSTFAMVPKGTVSLAFNHKGNLLLANWDYQFLLSVVSRLTIPCPHCGKKIPVRLRPQHKRPAGSQPGGPMI